MSLPETYKQLTSIISSGTQYIDTGVPPTVGLSIEIDLQMTSATNNKWFCGGVTSYSKGLEGGIYNNVLYTAMGFSYSEHASLLDRVTATGVCTTSTGESVYNIFLFSRNTNGSPADSASCKVFSAKIYEDDILIRDFIPAQRLSDGEIGLYDLANDVFYTNAGEGTFEDGTPVWRISNGYPYIEGLDFPQSFSYSEPYPSWVWQISEGGYPLLAPLELPKPPVCSEPYPTWEWRVRDGSYPYLAPLSESDEFPSENYIKSIKKSTRQTKITGEVTLGDTLMITIENNIIKLLSKSNFCMNSDMFLPGAANAAEFTLDLKLPESWTAENFYSTKISLSFWILAENGTWEECPLGTFIPSEVTKSSPGFVKIIGYDDMMRLKEIPVSGISKEYGFFNTAYGWLKAISKLSGIPLCQSYEEMMKLPNANIEFMLENFSEIKTLWDALSEICKHTNCIAFINRRGELELSELKAKEPLREITAAERISESFSALEYGTKQLDVTIAYTNDSHGVYVYSAKDESIEVGIAAELPEVVPWRRLSGTPPVSEVFESLKTARFRPFEAEIFGDPSLELGDWVKFTDFAAGESGFTAPITSFRWEWRGTHAISSCGSDTVFGAAKSRFEKLTAAQKEELLNDITNAEAKNLGTWADTAKYTWGELARFTWDQIGGNSNG